MNLRAALADIVAVQERMQVSEPASVQVRRAFIYSPHQGTLINASLPCWTNTWRMATPEVREGSFYRERRYVVTSQLHVARATDGDDSRSADIATAFMEVVHEAFGQQGVDGHGGVSLGGTVTQQQLLSVEFGLIDRAGGPYIGLEVVLELEIKDSLAGGFS